MNLGCVITRKAVCGYYRAIGQKKNEKEDFRLFAASKSCQML